MQDLHVHQSLPLCIALASIGGIMEVAATACTALPQVRERQGYLVTPFQRWMAVLGNVFLQMLGGIFSALFATWFGPVSIVVPFYYCATLLTNMVVFGVWLGEETFQKPLMRVGTHVIVLAVILLPVVGPTVSPNQTFAILIQHWYSILWFFFLVLTTLVTGGILIWHGSWTDTDPETNRFLKEYTSTQRTAVLLLCRAATMSVDLTVSRFLVLSPPSALVVGALIGTKLWSGNLCTYCIVVQSYSVEQARYVPLNATMVILVNALTGILVWEDQPQSWYGYFCVFWLLGIGCDVLLSVPLLTPENLEFGTNKNAKIIISEGRRKLTGDTEEIKKLLFHHHDITNEELDNQEQGTRRQSDHDSNNNNSKNNSNNNSNKKCSNGGDTTPKRRTGDYQSITTTNNNNDGNENGSIFSSPESLQRKTSNDNDAAAAWPRDDARNSAMSPLTPPPTFAFAAASTSPFDSLWMRNNNNSHADEASFRSRSNSYNSTTTTLSHREAWSEVISPSKQQPQRYGQKRRRASTLDSSTYTGGGVDATTTTTAAAAYFHTRVVRQPRIPSSPIPR